MVLFVLECLWVSGTPGAYFPSRPAPKGSKGDTIHFRVFVSFEGVLRTNCVPRTSSCLFPSKVVSSTVRRDIYIAARARRVAESLAKSLRRAAVGYSGSKKN